MKFFIACVALIASSLAEPPVNRKPSSTYGTPSNARPNSQYLPPSNQYGLPRTSTQYQAPRNQYLPPTSQYQAPTNEYQVPASQYRAPTSQYQAQTSQYQTPSSQYGLPNQGLSQAVTGIQYNAPSQEYGTPSVSRAGSDYQQSRQYLPPGGAYDDGSNGEPANYNFEYMVRDAYSGNDFGHRESRQGDRAEGLYYVLLPDGRKQTVEYEADQDGYKPRISYEDTGVRSGYSDNQSGYSGNQSGYSGSQSGYSGSQSGYENQYPSGPY
ncbi:pro-resilin-like [Melitaea cinxia]|uniref:pro-resilin-like n=1 Tax=Melitaea cinxia TaxID=113334 RepID=UPI001E26F379|nr:pro-resilin-like [Melitaea cinxia]